MNPDTPSSEIKREPLLLKEDSHGGESRALNISLRGWIALLVVVTLCLTVLWLVIHLPAATDFTTAAHFVEILFLPVVTAVITCYFATKQNNPNPPKP